MALREVTKVDTSSHVQTSLTVASEDQAFRGLSGSEIDGTMAAAEDAGTVVGDDAVGE
jgi:tRNA pseudouridine13 synthase